MRKSILGSMLATILFLGMPLQTGSVSAIGPDYVPDSPLTGDDAVHLPYKAPGFMGSEFHLNHAEGHGGVLVDLMHTSEGYVGVSARFDADVKFQFVNGDRKCFCDVPSNGEPVIVPITFGDGHYEFVVWDQIYGTNYRCAWSEECDVSLLDEFQPYLRPNFYVDYSESSLCVLKAKELAAEQEDAEGVVKAAFDWVCGAVEYDHEMAALIDGGMLQGYHPDLDSVVLSGKGVCLDYASLLAAMLRSQGIPTMVVFGDASPNWLYHAWNMVWVGGRWVRLDPTFVSCGADARFVGDGSNYVDELYY